MKNVLVAQSGGPTAAINASIFGILEEVLKNEQEINLFGAKYGVKGLLKEDILNLSQLFKNKQKELLLQTPGCVLGSCRYKLKDFNESEEEYEQLLKILRKNNINYFLYIGGNDSMDTVLKIYEYFKKKNINDIFVVGVPKTIDNDLLETDHCPGFGSCAKYIAQTFAEIERDCFVYDINSITIVETMGRDAGWLTAASCLSRLNGMKGPSLIYCCETAFSLNSFLKDIEEAFKEKKQLLIAVSEGLKNEKGELISKEAKYNKKDVFGHSQNAGVAKYLEEFVKQNIGCKVRSIEINLPQRAASFFSSKTDILESVMVGKKALEFALEQKTGVMATIKRKETEEYSVYYDYVFVEEVANKVKTVPKEFITADGKDVTQKAVRYLKPLIQGEQNFYYENGLLKFITLF